MSNPGEFACERTTESPNSKLHQLTPAGLTPSIRLLFMTGRADVGISLQTN